MESKVKALMDDWDYDKAVAIAKPIAQAWAKKTVEMARLLYVAREKLSNSGFRSDLIEYSPDGTSSQMIRGCNEDHTSDNIHSFEDFCNEIGISKPTAYRWIDCYDPDKDYLLSRDEAREAKQLELDTLYREVENKRKTEPSYAPKDLQLKWNRNLNKGWSESKFQKWSTQKNFKPPVELEPVEPVFLSRDAKIQEFGLWNTEFILDLQQKCQDISRENAERFADYVAVYKDLMPNGITSRELLRAAVVVEAIIMHLPDDYKEKCRSLLGSFVINDGLHNDSWLDVIRSF